MMTMLISKEPDDCQKEPRNFLKRIKQQIKKPAITHFKDVEKIAQPQKKHE